VATTDADQATIRLIVDVSLGTSPISGVVHADSSADREFVGWTALASVIDAALTTHGKTGDQSSTVADGGE
jgi:hypothetical protein